MVVIVKRKLIYLSDYRDDDFNINVDPCEICSSQKGCCTTCEKARRWFNKVGRILKGKE